MWIFSGFNNLVTQLTKPFRTHTQAVNTSNLGVAEDRDILSKKIVRGTVIRSRAGTYDCVVNTPLKPDLVCVPLVGAAGQLTGVTDAQLPADGASVLVYIDDPSSEFGVILGVIPAINACIKTSKFKNFWLPFLNTAK